MSTRTYPLRDERADRATGSTGIRAATGAPHRRGEGLRRPEMAERPGDGPGRVAPARALDPFAPPHADGQDPGRLHGRRCGAADPPPGAWAAPGDRRAPRPLRPLLR